MASLQSLFQKQGEETEPLSNTTSVDPPTNKAILIRHDSEFSVNSKYCVGEHNESRLNVWQGAALLTADCLGTGLLALPDDIHVLGAGLGLGFLLANLPINLYAGTIFHLTATAVEEKQQAENRFYSQSVSEGGIFTFPQSLREDNEDDSVDYYEVNQNTVSSYLSALQPSVDILVDYDSFQVNDTIGTNMAITGTVHKQLHHDTATTDFIGMTQALFYDRRATNWVMLIYYTNIFLVLGNYILVMSHAVAAVIGEDHICLPTAGLLASIGMFLVSQLRTMARLGKTASILSLSALFVVVVQCLWALRVKANDPDSIVAEPDTLESHSLLRKLSAFGGIGFAVGSQKLFLNIRHELADRSVAPKSLAMSLSAFGFFYVVIVLVAGPNPPSFLFDAIEPGWNRRVAGLLLWAHVVVSYAINSQAICSSMDRLLWDRLPLPSTIATNPPLRWLCLTATMSIFAYTVANAIPFFKDLVALIGAVTSVPLTLLFPAVFWRRHLSMPLWLPTMDSLWSIMLAYFSIVFMVAATIGSLNSIEMDWSAHGAPFSCH